MSATPGDFIIFDSNPNDIYSVSGITMDSPFCEIYRYEVVDNTAPDSTYIQYPSQYVTAAATGCTDILPMTPATGEMAALASCN